MCIKFNGRLRLRKYDSILSFHAWHHRNAHFAESLYYTTNTCRFISLVQILFGAVINKIWNGFVITTGVWLTNKKNKFYLEEISGYENLNLSFYNSAILMPFYFDKDVNEMNGQFTLELKPSWNAILCLFYICIETLCLDFLSVLYLFPISIL